MLQRQMAYLVMSAPVLPRSDRTPNANDVSFSEELVEHFVLKYTDVGDLVLDPFAGFGTTLAVAARLDRRAIGIEILSDLANHLRRDHPRARVIEGDARAVLRDHVREPVQLVMTSPPYMTAIHHPQNPLTGYQTMDGDYETYLRELTEAFVQAGDSLATGGRIVINAANIRLGSHVTTLAWDIGKRLSPHLQLEDEVVLCWPEPDPKITNDYCLVFRAHHA